MDSYQIFYQNEENGQYINLLKEFWNGVNDNHRQNALDEVSVLLQDLHDYCKDIGSDYSEMTFELFVNSQFNVCFMYVEIEDFDSKFLDEWKSNNLI